MLPSKIKSVFNVPENLASKKSSIISCLYSLACIYLATVVIVFLTAITIRHIWLNRTPMRLVSVDDVREHANATWPRRRIPRIIHQIWRTRDILPKWNGTHQSVIAQVKDGFEYRLWTDEERYDFVQKHEPEFYKKVYMKYSYEIQRVDSFRYVLLYHMGGIYIDMDVGSKRPFKELLVTLEALDPDNTHLAALPRDRYSPSVESDFLISAPGHPFFKQLISQLHWFNHYFLFYSWTVRASAGPVYVSVQERFFSSSPQYDTLRILDHDVVQPMFVWKSDGGTWNGRDNEILVYVGTKFNAYSSHLIIFTVFVATFLAISTARRIIHRFNYLSSYIRISNG